jgi:hypothetical protein
MNASDLIQIDPFGNGKWIHAYLIQFGNAGIWAYAVNGTQYYVPDGNYALVW